MSPTEIELLGKGLGFAPTPSSVNEADLYRDFAEFKRKMRCKWHFRNEVQNYSSNSYNFKSKSTWNPPLGHAALELFLSKTEKDVFALLPGVTRVFNLNREEYLAMRNLQNDRSIVIKPADKGSSVVIWDRDDYLKEGDKHLRDTDTYKKVQISENDLVKLVEKSNCFFDEMKRKGVIGEKERNYFKINFKNATNVGKMYLLPKIHKKLYDVHGRPVISNCDMATEKVSEFLDHILQPK